MNPTRTRIKFCGMSRVEDVRLAVELGIDCIGLVFAERSPRRLAIDHAARLRALVPQDIGVVALVMDNPRGAVHEIVTALRPDFLQFHGSEDDAFCAGFGLPFFKAIAMGDGGDAADAMAKFPAAHGFVLDGHSAGGQGGSGRGFDWTRFPHGGDKPSLLAGGLTADNVALAVRAASPWGVDVASGIESAPGIKNAAKMRAFVAAVRCAERQTDNARAS